MTRLRLSAGARQDMADIWRHGARRWSPQQADRYAAEIDERLALLLEHPQAGRIRHGLAGRYRSLSAGRHVIYYRLDGDGVFVVRILHGRMDAPRHLG